MRFETDLPFEMTDFGKSNAICSIYAICGREKDTKDISCNFYIPFLNSKIKSSKDKLVSMVLGDSLDVTLSASFVTLFVGRVTPLSP